MTITESTEFSDEGVEDRGLVFRWNGRMNVHEALIKGLADKSGRQRDLRRARNAR